MSNKKKKNRPPVILAPCDFPGCQEPWEFSDPIGNEGKRRIRCRAHRHLSLAGTGWSSSASSPIQDAARSSAETQAPAPLRPTTLVGTTEQGKQWKKDFEGPDPEAA